MPRLIIGIIGDKNSGKSIVFEYLQRKRGVFSVRTSDVLRDILVRLGLDPSDRVNNYARLGEALRKTFGHGILVEACLQQARQSAKRIVAVEGMRRWKELAVLRRMRNFKLLYVTAPAKLRWQRARRRTRAVRKDDQVSFQKFKQIERTLITEVEIPRMGKVADIRIDNLGTKRVLFKKVDAAMRSFQRH